MIIGFHVFASLPPPWLVQSSVQCLRILACAWKTRASVALSSTHPGPHFNQLPRLPSKADLRDRLRNLLHTSSSARPIAQTTTPVHTKDNMDAYNFPNYRLKKKMDDASKTPLLLVACGSFSPITFLHLRMFVMAADYVKFSTDFEIVGGYLSPVSDAYKKAGLASAEHR
jgi:Cytidylyltransferase-like